MPADDTSALRERIDDLAAEARTATLHRGDVGAFFAEYPHPVTGEPVGALVGYSDDPGTALAMLDALREAVIREANRRGRLILPPASPN